MDNIQGGGIGLKRKLALFALILAFLVVSAIIFYPARTPENPAGEVPSSDVYVDSFGSLGLYPFFVSNLFEQNESQFSVPYGPTRILILSQVLFGLSVAIFLVGRKFDFDGVDRRLIYYVCIGALAARVIMLIGAGDTFPLSDDVYRYVWDGKVAANGINPFLYSPESAELVDLRDETIFPHINHPHLPTIYPPLAQNIFHVSYLLGGDSTISFKLISALFEILAFLSLLIWLKLLNIPRATLLLYLFSPLILIEFDMSAHIDILAMPFLITALITVHKRRPGITGILIALAAMVKLLGLFFVPVLFFHFRKREKLLFAGSFALTTVLMYLPYAIGAEGKFLGSLLTYVETWRYYSSVAGVFSGLFSFEIARYVCGSLLLIWLAYAIIAKTDVVTKLFRAIGGYIVLTTTLFPWYLVWVLPFAVQSLSKPFLLLTGTILLSYHLHFGLYLSGTWFDQLWLRLLTYLPFYVLLIWQPLRRKVWKQQNA